MPLAASALIWPTVRAAMFAPVSTRVTVSVDFRLTVPRLWNWAAVIVKMLSLASSIIDALADQSAARS